MTASSGVVTFLFTDIEGSTRRWEADAEAMRTALETHNKVLRETVEAHAGNVFNYTGDGMCAVFASPRSAVDAAVAAQRALELPVRMGIATGEAELRGGEYFGTVLNRASRVMAAGQDAIESGRFYEVSAESQAMLGGGYANAFPAERIVKWSHSMMAQSAKGCSYCGPQLVFTLTFAGSHDEAMTVSEQLFATADTALNPHIVCGATLAYGHTHRKVDPAAAYDALRRGLTTAQASSNRQMESTLAVYLAGVAATYADPTEAFELLTLAIRTYYDSGSLVFFAGAVGVLAALFDRLAHYEAAAIISGFADIPISRASFPEIGTAITHLREVLGDEAYEAFARAGSKMTKAAKAAYALDHIDRARAALRSDTS